MGSLRRWWFWVGAVVVLGVVGFFAFRPEQPVEYVTEVVGRENLVQTVDANGEVVSLDEVELSFDLSGTVESILVSVGDAVVVGDLLAVLETNELIADVQSAYQAVHVAQGNLDAQKAGASEESIAVSAASLASAQTDYANKVTLSPFVESLYLAEENVQASALETASDNLFQTIDENGILIADAYDDLLGSAWAGVIEARSAYAKGDEVLGINNTTLNDDYQNVLSSGNASAVESAKTALTALKSSLSSAESAIISAHYGSSGTIVTSAEYVEEALDHAAALLLYIRAAVSAMPATGELSVSEATTLASSIDTARAALQVDQAALQNAFQTVQDALNTASVNLEDANNALAQAQASYDAAVASREYQVTVADQAISSAQAVAGLREAELKHAQAAPRVVDLASYESEVARAQATYASAQARLARAQMRSPIVGDVTEVSIEVGEQVTATGAVITVQTTQEQFEIVADVSESDIAKLAIGQQAEITFDAFGSSQKLIGEVRKIDPAEKLIESVVYYEVTVALTQGDQILALRPGLSADLMFTTDEKDDVLTISQRALQSRDGSTYVRVRKNGQTQERDVVVGLRGDLGRVEVVSGLEEGEEVVIREVTP
ncbi:efflux RND transporter periplasmic adaptor subunit [Candidatus Uhrbacteria bacterium]|nr:efflux RND transporter periplasmic adaptor subunit [Candidatus Uhrbacteria bacterium]